MNKKRKIFRGLSICKNMTANSPAWTGCTALPSGTKHPILLLALKKNNKKPVRDQTNCPHSRLQQSSSSTLLEHSYSLFSSSTVSAMLKVVSKKEKKKKKKSQFQDLRAGNIADAGAN